VRSLDWKLIGSKDKRELFNLASDPAESNDLAAQEANKVAELTVLYDKWLDEMAPPLNRSPKRWGNSPASSSGGLSEREKAREKERLERRNERKKAKSTKTPNPLPESKAHP